MNVTIHYDRPGLGVTHYVEELIEDDGVCLRTLATIPPEHRLSLSQQLWIDGLLRRPRMIATIHKHYFYHEHFDLLVFYDLAGQVAGYYSDVATPLQKVADGYAITDLFLDIWLTPEGVLHELDVDEFAEAIGRDLVPAGLQTIAWQTLDRLRDEVQAGIYPSRYLRG